MKLTRPMRVELEGRGSLTLNPHDHLATGGEGSVYVRGNMVIKLYTNPAKMQRDSMTAKIQFLAATFTHPYIVAPRGIVMDDRGAPIGFYMDHVDGEPFPRLFTNKVRTRSKFGEAQTTLVATRMLEIFRFAHDRHAVLVDPNELNWVAQLRGKNGPEPRILDVDSWSVGKWPPRAVMLSVKDFHTRGFTPLSDYFAWGVVTFQLYTGIHPYKGDLPGYTGINDLEARMRNNASVFSPGILLPMAVRDFGCIPGPLLGWYEATFQQGERTMPPSPRDTGVTAPARQVKVTRITTTASGTLRYQRLLDNADPALRVFPCGVVICQSGTLYDLVSKRLIATNVSLNCEVARVENGWLIGEPNTGTPTFTYINHGSHQATKLDLQVTSHGLVRYENRMFTTTEDGLTELHVKVFAKPLLVVGRTWGALPRSTTWFDGVGIQDAMGATFLIAPFGADACGQVRVRELDGLRPVAAKAGYRFVSVVAIDATGQYKKIEFTFNDTYDSYTTWEGPAINAELNMALIAKPKGVVGATIVRDRELVIFVPTAGKVNKVADKDVTTTMALGTWQDRVVFVRDGQVWGVTMQ